MLPVDHHMDNCLEATLYVLKSCNIHTKSDSFALGIHSSASALLFTGTLMDLLTAKCL
jgi:VanZ family protein